MIIKPNLHEASISVEILESFINIVRFDIDMHDYNGMPDCISRLMDWIQKWNQIDFHYDNIPDFADFFPLYSECQFVSKSLF